MEGPHKVLACVDVDAGLAADSAVHHCEQRGGHQSEGQASECSRGRKPGEVTGDPTAQTQDHGVPVHPELHKRLNEAAPGRQGLVFFAVWDQDDLTGDPSGAQLREAGVQRDRRHDRVGHHDHPLPSPCTQRSPEPFEAAAHHDVVAPVTQRYGLDSHWPSKAATTRAAPVAGLHSDTSTSSPASL